MIKNIIFDFGDVFINLDKKQFALELAKLGITEENKKIKSVFNQYEKGLINTYDFLQFFKDTYKISKKDMITAWNCILKDFPKKRFSFLKELVESKKYRLFLLSNTNDLHISWVKEHWGLDTYKEFENCFEKFYLSYEINFRKPNLDIYEFVLKENNLVVQHTVFIDDTKENTDAANELGIHTWNLIPRKDDVIQLFHKKANLF